MLLVTVALGAVLNPLNSSMIAVALPDIGRHFDVAMSQLTWLIATFYLVSAVAQPVMGKVSDLYGRRRIFFAGLALAAVASVLAPWSPILGVLILFRMTQALGTSILYPAGMSAVRHAFGRHTPRALGILGMFSSVSAAIGPSLGGLLVDWGGWQGTFFINLVPVALSMALAWKVFPHDARTVFGTPTAVPNRPARRARPAGSPLDLSGALLFGTAVVGALTFLLSLSEGSPAWWGLPPAALAGIAFVRHEARTAEAGKEPFMDVTVFSRDRIRVAIYLAWILSNVVFYCILFGMPTYFESVRQLDVRHTGFVMLSVAAVSSLTSPILGHWVDRTGHRPALAVAVGSSLAALLCMAAVGPEAPLAVLVVVLAMLGASNAFNNLALQAALYRFVPMRETGAASGLFMMCRHIGSILASMLLGLIFRHSLDAHMVRDMGLLLLIPALAMWAATRFIPEAASRPASRG